MNNTTLKTLLQPDQAALLLRLRPRQRLLLRVEAGRLWLTEDGRPDDHVLANGEQRALHGPACYRLSAFGPEAARVVCSITAWEYEYG